MPKPLLVMIGGCLGALCRYGASLLAVRLFGAAFPWGTLFVNLTGCLLIGMSFELSERQLLIGPSTRLLLVTGFLGALTTFSTFALESVNFGREGNFAGVVVNFLANNVLGLLLVLVGMWIVRELL